MSKRMIDEPDPLIEDFYEIERIMGVSGDKERYLVKWKGWGEEHNSWEPRENLNDAALNAIMKDPKRIKPNTPTERSPQSSPDSLELITDTPRKLDKLNALQAAASWGGLQAYDPPPAVPPVLLGLTAPPPLPEISIPYVPPPNPNPNPNAMSAPPPPPLPQAQDPPEIPQPSFLANEDDVLERLEDEANLSNEELRKKAYGEHEGDVSYNGEGGGGEAVNEVELFSPAANTTTTEGGGGGGEVVNEAGLFSPTATTTTETTVTKQPPSIDFGDCVQSDPSDTSTTGNI